MAWKDAGECVSVSGLALCALVQAAREEIENFGSMNVNVAGMILAMGFEWVPPPISSGNS